MKRDPAVQEAIDWLLPRAARLRQERGPDDDSVFRFGKALAALMEPKRRANRKGRAVKVHTQSGVPLTISRDRLEEGE